MVGPANLAMDSDGEQKMAVTGSGRRNTPLWIDIPLSLVAFLAVWMGVTVLLNLSGGDPAFSGWLGSFPAALLGAAILTVIRIWRRAKGR
jgi:hypothetical protein